MSARFMGLVTVGCLLKYEKQMVRNSLIPIRYQREWVWQLVDIPNKTIFKHFLYVAGIEMLSAGHWNDVDCATYSVA